jgi:glycosyltransferase involved in cell wall biosynthesis
MRIVIISDWFAEKMGYTENVLPKTLGKLGAEVHLVTSDLQPPLPNYKEAYEPFLGSLHQPLGCRQLEGFMLHRLPSGRTDRGIQIRGLLGKLRKLKPDVVQCLTLISYSTAQAAIGKLLMRYELFLEEHAHRSVFPSPSTLQQHTKLAAFRWLMGKPLGLLSRRCYPIAEDVADIVINDLGYRKDKVTISPLGVDTDIFRPASTPAELLCRSNLRHRLGFSDRDIICIYTGRFSPDKNPLCLARAVDRLSLTHPQYSFRAFFVGSGREDQVRAIRDCRGSRVHEFVPYPLLPDYYRMADIAVWPKQESTSQLDAAASGIPVVLSDRAAVRERIEGNGFVFQEDNVEDLSEVLLRLADPSLRRVFGDAGARRMAADFSWNRIARRRLDDYEAAVSGSWGRK